MRIALIVPTTWEFEPFQERLNLDLTTSQPFVTYDGKIGAVDLRAVVSYIGPSNAAAATQFAISSHRPHAVLLGGAAGAVSLDNLPGDIVIGSQYTTLASPEVLAARKTLALSPSLIRYMLDGQAVHAQLVEADPELINKAWQIAQIELQKLPDWTATPWPNGVAMRPAKIALERIGSADWWTRDPLQLQFFREQFAVTVEDMESSYVAQVAAINKVPFLAVRGIANNENFHCVPSSSVFAVNQLAASRAAAVVTALIESLV